MNRRLPQEVRIIGGTWKRSRLPVADAPGLRPTPDRVRETLFNWLGQDLSGARVLDAFAGSGALGFEAASRGAARVLMLESNPGLVRSLATTQQRLGAAAVAVQTADALVWMERAAPASFDLVLLDPPFDVAWADRAVAAAAPLVAAGGALYLEAGRALAHAPAGFEAHRHLRAGAVHAHLFLRTGE